MSEESITSEKMFKTLSCFQPTISDWGKYKVYIRCNDGVVRSIDPEYCIVLPGPITQGDDPMDISLQGLEEFNGGFFFREL
jgi:hypothetical protein